MKQEMILGYPVSNESIEGCLEQITDWLDSDVRCRFFACANPHSLIVAGGDPDFREALINAHLLTADGVGILYASRILGGNIRQRVTGCDVFYGLNNRLNFSRNSCYSYFFLGSTDETLDKIQAFFSRDYPNIRFAGSYSPPFKPDFNSEDNRKMIASINAAKPDVLWVGMTAPKQEKWIYQNRDKLDVKFIGAIGAVFDFYVGNVKRSSPIFQKMGLEWLPRFIQEPRRLWRRNFISNPKFMYRVICQKINGGKS